MTRSIGAQIALLAFTLATLAGLLAGNSAATVLWRALLAMAAAYLVGQVVAAVGKAVLRDHLQRRKLAIDHQHLEASRTRATDAVAPAASPAKTG
jgi:hypothetical protein